MPNIKYYYKNEPVMPKYAMSEVELKEMSLKSFNYTEIFNFYYIEAKLPLGQALQRFAEDLRFVGMQESVKFQDASKARYREAREAREARDADDIIRGRILEAFTLTSAIKHFNSEPLDSIIPKIKMRTSSVKTSTKCDNFVKYLEGQVKKELITPKERSNIGVLSPSQRIQPQLELKKMKLKAYDFTKAFNRYYDNEGLPFGRALLKLSEEWNTIAKTDSLEFQNGYGHRTQESEQQMVRSQILEAFNFRNATRNSYGYRLGTVVANIELRMGQSRPSAALTRFLTRLKLREAIIARQGILRYTSPFKSIFYLKDNPIEWLEALKKLNEICCSDNIDPQLREPLEQFIAGRFHSLFLKYIPNLLLKQGSPKKAMNLLENLFEKNVVPSIWTSYIEYLNYSISVLPPAQNMRDCFFSGQYILPNKHPASWFRQLGSMLRNSESAEFFFLTKELVNESLDDAYARLFEGVIPAWILQHKDFESVLKELHQLDADIEPPKAWQDILKGMIISLVELEKDGLLLNYFAAGTRKEKFAVLEKACTLAHLKGDFNLYMLEFLRDANQRLKGATVELKDFIDIIPKLFDFQTRARQASTFKASSSSATSEASKVIRKPLNSIKRSPGIQATSATSSLTSRRSLRASVSSASLGVLSPATTLSSLDSFTSLFGDSQSDDDSDSETRTVPEVLSLSESDALRLDAEMDLVEMNLVAGPGLDDIEALFVPSLAVTMSRDKENQKPPVQERQSTASPVPEDDLVKCFGKMKVK